MADLGVHDRGAADATLSDAALGEVGVPALPACGPATAAGVRHDDVPYGPDPRQILDLYLTDRVDPATPVFVWVHGGGWEGGTHARVPQPVLGLLARGVAVVSVEYRLSDTPFPSTLSDVRAALRWLRAHAADHGIDGDRLVVGGSSAGGHLVSILGTASEVTALDVDPLAGPAPRPALVVDFFGPTELSTLDADGEASGCPAGALCHDCVGSPEARLVDCEGPLSTCPEVAALASPLSHVDRNDSPFFMVHGALDCVVPPPQSQRMHAALQAVGVPSSLIIVEDAGHSIAEVGTAEVWQQIYRAIDAHVLGCVRPEMAMVPDPAPGPPIDDCRVDACPAESAACEADPACLALHACTQACRGAEGCRASCAAGVPAPVAQRHRALFECSRAAGCR